MGIKVIDSLPIIEKKEKLKDLMEDIREIIRNRIRICEIVNTKYSSSTMRERLNRAMREVLWDLAKTVENGKERVPNAKEVFTITMRKEDGEPHWYVLFDVDLWNRRMEFRPAGNDDITFCQEDCKMENCMRNKKNIRDRKIPHSFSVERPKDCPRLELI